MTQTLYKYLNLPNFEPITEAKVPDEVITDMKLFNRSVRKMSIVDKEGNEMPPADYVRARADDKYNDYILNLIPELEGHIREIGFQSIRNGANHPNGSQLIPHTDMKRGDFCIQWLITTGGDNVKTRWWKEKDKDLIRPPWTPKLDYNDLDLVDEINWVPNHWGIFRTDVIHSVNGVMNERKAFAIGMASVFENNTDILFNKIIEKYGMDL